MAKANGRIKVTKQFASDVAKGQREAIELGRRFAAEPTDLGHFYTATEATTAAQGRALAFTQALRTPRRWAPAAKPARRLRTCRGEQGNVPGRRGSRPQAGYREPDDRCGEEGLRSDAAECREGNEEGKGRRLIPASYHEVKGPRRTTGPFFWSSSLLGGCRSEQLRLRGDTPFKDRASGIEQAEDFRSVTEYQALVPSRRASTIPPGMHDSRCWEAFAASIPTRDLISPTVRLPALRSVSRMRMRTGFASVRKRSSS